MDYVLTAINLPVKNLFKQFIYSIPDELGKLAPGWRVIVPFGAQQAEGFVVRRFSAEETKCILSRERPDFSLDRIKPVKAVLGSESWFSQEMLETAKWLGDYYLCSLAEAMRLFIPGKSSIKRRVAYRDGKLTSYVIEERLKPRTVLAYTITSEGRDALKETVKRFKAQQAALVYLEKSVAPVDLKEAESRGISSAVLRTLAGKGWVRRMEKRVLRNSYDREEQRQELLRLTGEQQQAVEAVKSALNGSFASAKEAVPREFLLQGITGSGKTEVYLRAAEYALKQRKQVLVLVPEIALTAQIVQRFRAWFKNEVTVAHSKLSQNERGDVWYKMRSGEANILIGVRSAVFAPFKNLGLVIVDEEQENSYKQEERPGYHAREVARRRCAGSGAVLLLGSATPSLETYYRAQTGLIGHLRLTERPTGALLPRVEIVDMREELAQKNFSVISRKLRRELISNAHEGQQAIVLLNRRGYSTFVMCRDCGAVLMCPHCAVSLVYHANEQVMRCHYCGHVSPVPKSCPGCGSNRIKFFGSGTQKAEEEIGRMPGVNVLRMDQDSTSAKLAHEALLRRFAAGEYNVLLGTQMVAKGHDIRNVTLVGILAADSTLNLPDFRASERGFDLLTQAAGRAGRGNEAGWVILQTYDPENEIIRLAAGQDYDTFAARELAMRKELFYPPYSEILKLTIADQEEENAWKLADELTGFLRERIKTKRTGNLPEEELYQDHPAAGSVGPSLQNTGSKQASTEIMGPFPSGVAKVRDLYRINIVIKSDRMEQVKSLLMNSRYKSLRNVYFDVDPVTAI